jgi:hypothetical protein
MISLLDAKVKIVVASRFAEHPIMSNLELCRAIERIDAGVKWYNAYVSLKIVI